MKIFLLFGLACALPAFPQTSSQSSTSGNSFETTVKRAEAARAADKTQEAIGLYQQAVRARANWSEGWWYLGTLNYDSDRYAEGGDAFRRLTELEPKMAIAWAMLGLCEFETKKYDRSLDHLQRGIQLGLSQDQTFFEVAQYHFALLLSRSEHFDAAIEILSKFAAHGPVGPKFVEAMGIACLHKPVLPSELPPTEREIVMDVGRAMCDAAGRRTADAIPELESILKQHPDQPQLHYLYGMVLLANDPDKALIALKDEIAISPSHPEALVSIAGEYVKRSDYKSALPYAEKAVQSNPDYFAAHAMLGKVLVEGDLDVARGTKELETAVHLAPGNLQARFSLATAYAKAGRKEDAARERAEFLRLRSQTDGAAAQQN